MMNETDFYSTHINDSLDELLRVRNHLLRLIKDYEERFILTEFNRENSKPADLIKPTPKERYEMNNKYLVEITKLIIIKTN